MLDGFWQEILFDDSGFDRAAAAQICGTYLDLLDSGFRNSRRTIRSNSGTRPSR
jgi:hypothetical protein